MKRREFITLVGGATAAFPLVVRAQQRSTPPRVGYIFSFTRAEGEPLWQACREALSDLGYVEGRSIILEPRWAEGRYERPPASSRICYASRLTSLLRRQRRQPAQPWLRPRPYQLSSSPLANP